MRTEGEVKQKFKQIKFRARKESIEEGVKRVPCNCKHNQIKQFDEKSVGTCLYSRIDHEWDVLICDGDTDDGVSQARKCPNFSLTREAASIKLEFDEMVRDAYSDIGIMAYYYPDMAALFWVINENLPVSEPDPPDVETPKVEEPAPPTTVSSSSIVLNDQNVVSDEIHVQDGYDDSVCPGEPMNEPDFVPSDKMAEAIKSITDYGLNDRLFLGYIASLGLSVMLSFYAGSESGTGESWKLIYLASVLSLVVNAVIYVASSSARK